MKFLTKASLLVLCMVFSLNLSAQVIEKSTKTEYIGGKTYYLHTVKGGQTLYAIANAYSTTVDNILAANPGLKKDLKIDQVIKVPYVQSLEPAPGVTVHIVKSGETLSSIASQYSVTLEAIFRLNPGLTASIKPGQEIKIPKEPQVAKADLHSITQNHTVGQGETLFSIAKKYGTTVDQLKQMNPGLNESIHVGQSIRVPMQKPEITPPQQKKDTVIFECGKTGKLPSYNVGLLIPLYLDRATYIDTTDEEKTVKNYSSFAFIGFYEGFMIAVDSLKSKGLNLNLMVDDIAEDSSRLENILNKSSYADLNLLIGPFFSNVFEEAADWARKKEVKIVNPFTSRSEFVKDNPQVFKNTASDAQQTRLTVEYIRKTWPGCRIILSHCNRDTDKDLVDAYLSALKGADSSASDYSVTDYTKEGIAGITKNMSADRINVVISFVQGEASTSNFIRYMSEASFNYPLVVFGPASWEQYNSLESEYLLNIHLHIAGPTFVDYSKPEVKDFVVKYRERYHTEPDEYAFSGYDVAMYYLEALRIYGKDFQHCLDQYEPELLQTHLKFGKLPQGGYENTRICIFRYNDYKRVDAMVDPQTEIPVNKK